VVAVSGALNGLVRRKYAKVWEMTRMRDPHVVALHYKIEHAEYVDYAKAAPFEGEADAFKIHIDQDQATFEMMTHFATAEEARAVVNPFIRCWELHVGLEFQPDELKFRFDRPEIIDRDRAPGQIHEASLTMTATARIDAQLTRKRERYPAPPNHFVVSPAVEAMYARYALYRDDRELLPSMAYFCYTVVLKAAGNEKKAAEKYSISGKVLKSLRILSSRKGGPLARKADAIGAPLSPSEEKWLEEAVKTIIRRAAETAAEKSGLQKITMAGLPKLP
jgi:hypothetical protein